MGWSVSGTLWLAWSLGVMGGAPRTASTPVASELRTFTIDRPRSETHPEEGARVAAGARLPDRLPQPHDVLHTSVGVGYVQGADWGTEVLASGSVADVQVELNSLVTKGNHGTLFDRGTLMLFDPRVHWRLEAGDVFSGLRGASWGARLSWATLGERHPSISVLGPRPGTSDRRTLVSYRDQIRVGSQTVLDGELASDKSHVLITRWVGPRFDLEASYRRNLGLVHTSDRSLSAAFDVWHGVRVRGGVLRSARPGERSEWRTLALRLPVSRALDLTLERTVSTTGTLTNTTSAAMANVDAGPLRFFHRYQRGETQFVDSQTDTIRAAQQIQSMTSYGLGARLHLTLQLATEWTANGRARTWEELQTSFQLTRQTVIDVAIAVPDVADTRRFRARLSQRLPYQFSLDAEVGRLAPFQMSPFFLDRSRVKVMLRKNVDVATPAGGGNVRGRVVDQTGRPVAGARVTLGAYEVDTDENGEYVFAHVPRGQFDLGLDEAFLPADYAWDGRRIPLAVTPSSHERVDLRVAPLNAIHGRVYTDRNNNGRPDAGEEVAGAVVRLGDRVTASDRSGAYSFYNLEPGEYVVSLDVTKLPEPFTATGSTVLHVTLTADRPVTGADFRVIPKDKGIIWRGVK